MIPDRVAKSFIKHEIVMKIPMHINGALIKILHRRNSIVPHSEVCNVANKESRTFSAEVQLSNTQRISRSAYICASALYFPIPIVKQTHFVAGMTVRQSRDESIYMWGVSV